MSLKQRFSWLFSLLFSIVLAAVMLTVYYLFANFRQEEFIDRLEEKAETTAKLLVEVKEIDYNTQKLIDKNSITRLYNEKTQVFDGHKKCIYSSNETKQINWGLNELDQIRKNKKMFRKARQFEILGLYYTFGNKYYYVLISAEDTYGNRKLNYLKYLLLGAFIISTSMVGLLSFSVSKKSLEPLDNFRKQIQEITDNNLTIRFPKVKREDEIAALANSFNQMMGRIDNAYNRQREFTSNASHELRTPVARIAAQLENMLQEKTIGREVKAHLASIADDIFQLSEIISSMVALTEISNYQPSATFEKIRLDEIIFSAAAELGKLYPNFRLKFEIENTSGRDTDIEVSGDETLLKIVLLNLLKNAFIYADNGIAECLLLQKENSLTLMITNSGEVPQVSDTSVLFNTFYRGSNTRSTVGSGVGLSIVKQVLQYHKASIHYHVPAENTNQFIVTFPVQF